MKLQRALLNLAASMVFAAAPAIASPMMADVSPDGAIYTLDWTNVGSTYTFTFQADFQNVTATPPVGTYALAYSIATTPGSVDWSAGAISEAPGDESNWSIYTGVVTNSNGCPGAGSDSKDWCVGLNTPGDNNGPVIAQGSVVRFVHTMVLASGAPDFAGTEPWSYKFVTTTGTTVTDGNANNRTTEWQFGNYQISRHLAACTSATQPGCGGGGTVPEPTSMLLLGAGLLGLATRVRR